MSSRRLFTLAISGAAVIALVLMSFLAFPYKRHDSHTLPETPLVTVSAAGGENVEGISRVTVNADTVREIIATLNRPEAYKRDIMIESFWDDGNAVYNFSISFAKEMTAIRLSHIGMQKTIIIRDGYAHIKNKTNEPFTSIPLDSPNAGDEYQMIPTYEDVVSLERESILDAGLRATLGGEPVIYVRWQSGDLGYITDAYVSVRLGLLLRAETRDGDTLIYRMTAGDCDLTEPDESVFIVN